MTTGISAADRARTIAVAIDSSKSRDEIVTPATSSHWSRATAACWCAPAIPRRRSTCRGRRPQPLGRDLRDHERGRDDGAVGRPRHLRAIPQPQDRHDPRPDRLSPPLRPSRREACRGAVHQRMGRRMDRAHLLEQGDGHRTDRAGQGQGRSRQADLVRMHALSPFADIFGEGRRPRRAAAPVDGDHCGGRRRRDRRHLNRPRADQFTVALQARAGTLPAADMEDCATMASAR